MLNPKYRYIGLDFETTGLDTEKDEPIQIGIVEIDHKGKPIDQFSSLLKPNKDISQLKDIVSFITGLALEDLDHAPNIKEIFPKIEHFF
jgi:ATP-dependent DNA helicase DinG